jgi:hypothetical protein
MTGILGGLLGSSSIRSTYNWALSATLPDSTTKNYSQGVVFAAGKFILLRSPQGSTTGNTYLYSSDGVTWTTGTGPSNVRTIASNGSRIVMFPESAVPQYSDNGTTWTAGTGGSTGNPMRDAYWTGSRFVAVNEGSLANIISSTDGISWATSDLGDGASSITNNGSTFVAVDPGTTGSRSTDNGNSWSAITLPVNRDWSSVKFINGIYVAIVNVNAGYATSPDGITWTARTLPAAPGAGGNSGEISRLIVIGNAIFYVATTGDLYTSTDGINWTLLLNNNLGTNVSSTGVAVGNGIAIISLANSDNVLIGT